MEGSPHPDIPAEFPGVILDMEDDVEPLLELLDETAKEENCDVFQKPQEWRHMVQELQEYRGPTTESQRTWTLLQCWFLTLDMTIRG